ncbi:MAG: type II toxin-antitoxin system RelE family toxin [Chitinophagaceae bacterium]
MLSTDETPNSTTTPPSYIVYILPAVIKLLRRFPLSVQNRLEEKMLSLGQNPRPKGCKKLTGREAWRIRAGDYRIIYEIQDNELIVTVITIGHRKNVYD